MDQLCSFCQNFATQVWEYLQSDITDERQHDIRNLLEWKRSALQHASHAWPPTCRLCSLIWGVDALSWSGGDAGLMGAKDGYFDVSRSQGNILELILSNDDDNDESMDVLFARPADASDSVWRKDVEDTGDQKLQPSASTWSASTIKQVHAWLQDCGKSHPGCQPVHQTQPTLPMRFLDTNPSGKPFHIPQDDGDMQQFSIQIDPFVRTCLTKDLPVDTPYLTLSHCWGGKPSILLGHKNIQILSERLPLVDLMAEGASLLRDAILITRSLGHRYIWVDTICLNQDDDAEKMDQISKMHEFYSNAVLNLSATASKSGIDSMILNRHLSTVMPLTLQMGSDDVETNESSNSLIFFNVNWGSRIEFQKINSRGWVFQERMLARRVLHFAEDQVYWECHSLEAWDTNPSGKAALQANQSDQHMKRNLSLRGRHSARLAGTDHGQYVWLGLLVSYGSTVTTFPGDRLIAMSALARDFALAFGLSNEAYKAGLWLPHCPLALCWSSFGSRQRPGSYRAPTWSWASVEGNISYAWHILQTAYESDIVVVDSAVTTKVTTDPFSEVLGGRIRVRGRLFKGFYWEKTSGDETSYDDVYELLSEESNPRSTMNRISASSQQRLTFRMSFDVGRWYMNTPNTASEDRQPFFLLPVQTQEPESPNLDYDRLGVQADEGALIGRTCLILRRTPERGQFTREGIVFGKYWSFEEDDILRAKGKVEYARESMRRDDFISSEGDGEYTIDIV